MRINPSLISGLIISILFLASCVPSKKVGKSGYDPTTGISITPEGWTSTYNYDSMDEMTRLAHIAVEKYLMDMRNGTVTGRRELGPQVRIESVELDQVQNVFKVTFDTRFSEYPIRPATVSQADSVIRSYMPEELNTARIEMFSMGYRLEELIPIYYTRGTEFEGVFNIIEQDPNRRNVQGSASQSPSFETAVVNEEVVRTHLTRTPEVDPADGFKWIRNLDRPWDAPKGLESRQVAMWHSHGWYFNNQLKRWEWQRPRLFGTVEDMLPMSFVLPYIVPMLENAGAYVWLPRERDTQSHEVVIDNDKDLKPFSEMGEMNSGSYYTEISTTRGSGWVQGSSPGFNRPSGPLSGSRNPFSEGTYRTTTTDTVQTTMVRWVPEIPETGEYAVYISYASKENSTSDAHYRVYHSGGETNFLVNQQVGGGTWIYLGHFRFEKGGEHAVELSNRSKESGLFVTADGVRFGGGMGIVERDGRTSGRPRFLEAARYNLQYSGVPDTLVWKLNDNNDYNDDFQSRGEWVNYLRGAPFGPNRDRSAGLGLPVEVSVAFHTDAGLTLDDRIVGTLAIYSVPDMNFNFGFPDGQSRLANRDLTDIMQTQIVNDIHSRFDTTWVRRRLMNSRYSEAARPNVPSVLLELLSHQNFRDMEYAMDPRFRFEISRSIYKSIVKFVASQHNLDYVIQPLPVTDFSAEWVSEGLKLSWSGVKDPLEPTADPMRYVVYTREEQGGFDNGFIVHDNEVVIRDLKPGTLYSFKVRAANDGGVSMPSEVLSAVHQGANETVLIINGFTRVSSPEIIKVGEFRGFASFLDAGVPDRYDIGHVGEQVNFNLRDEWIENDNPGHGMSHGDLETTIIAGNTFDFAWIHANAIRNTGLNVVTVSESAVESGKVRANSYRLVNLILGNQRQSKNQTAFADSLVGHRYGIYGPGVRALLTNVATNGGGILVSGAHVGTDLVHRPQRDSLTHAFARDILKYDFTANHASRTGVVFNSVSGGQTSIAGSRGADEWEGASVSLVEPPVFNCQNISSPARRFQFNTTPNPYIYRVDAPDAIKPVGNRAQTWLRYAENEFSAAVRYSDRYRVVVLGFPFETIMDQNDRDNLMKEMINFLLSCPR